MTNNSYLCIKGIIRKLWHEGMFKARGTNLKDSNKYFVFFKGNQLKVVFMQI
jgi:hypothetical protein